MIILYICALKIEVNEPWEGIRLEEKKWVVATVEGKYSIADNSDRALISLATADMNCCIDGDATFKKYVCKEHVGQAIQQMAVFNVNLGLYVRETECSVACKLVTFTPNTLSNTPIKVISSSYAELVK